jgi:rfaE bifunctional protein nucleotidyltransferase chain/domain
MNCSGGRILTDRSVAASACEEQRLAGRTVVFTNGCFDILHKGHIVVLEAASREGDYLVVGVNSDCSVRRLKGAGRPVMPLESRMACLAAIRFVDLVVPFDEPDPAALVEALAPSVMVKGGDYRAGEIAGASSVLSAGGRVVIVPLFPGYSTSSAIERVGTP